MVAVMLVFEIEIVKDYVVWFYQQMHNDLKSKSSIQSLHTLPYLIYRGKWLGTHVHTVGLTIGSARRL